MINDGRIKLECIEIYITNECNLTCSNCNRYNNYDFRGHLDWRTSENALLTWGQRITADVITIIGGEPLTHPELAAWIGLIRRAWPEESIMIQSNGVVRRDDLTSILYSTYKLGIVASLHQPGMEKTMRKYLTVGRAKQIIDNTQFTACALQDQGSHFVVHDSEADIAFAACTMSRSHTLIDGVLFKCPMVAILPRFMQQYVVELTNKQKDLLDGYKPLEPGCSDSELQEFFINENKPIPQCTFCPSDGVFSPVTFDPKRKTRPRKEIS